MWYKYTKPHTCFDIARQITRVRYDERYNENEGVCVVLYLLHILYVFQYYSELFWYGFRIRNCKNMTKNAS